MSNNNSTPTVPVRVRDALSIICASAQNIESVCATALEDTMHITSASRGLFRILMNEADRIQDECDAAQDSAPKASGNDDDPAEAERQEIHAMRQEAQGVQDAGARRAVHKLANEMESELEDDATPVTRTFDDKQKRSDTDVYDELETQLRDINRAAELISVAGDEFDVNGVGYMLDRMVATARKLADELYHSK